jgi:hypothetical protein
MVAGTGTGPIGSTSEMRPSSGSTTGTGFASAREVGRPREWPKCRTGPAGIHSRHPPPRAHSARQQQLEQQSERQTPWPAGDSSAFLHDGETNGDTTG